MPGLLEPYAGWEGLQGYPAHKDVEVARHEDQGVEVLCFEGDACRIQAVSELGQQQSECEARYKL